MWAETSVFYQIYPLGFCGAPFENDGVPKNRIAKVDGVHDGAKLVVAVRPPAEHIEQEVNFCMRFIFHIFIISPKRLKITENVNACTICESICMKENERRNEKKHAFVFCAHIGAAALPAGALGKRQRTPGECAKRI